MKKKIALLAAFLILLSILAANSAAYDAADTTAHNVITTSFVDIEVVNQREEANRLVEDSRGEIRVIPGKSYSRSSSVRNNGAVSYIRAHVDLLFKDAKGEQMELTQEQIGKIVSVDRNSSDWLTKEGDAYWLYYRTAVSTGDMTKPLFTTVTFNGPNMGNEYQGSKLEIVVTAQAVQTANNGSDVMTAEGWPG